MVVRAYGGPARLWVGASSARLNVTAVRLLGNPERVTWALNAAQTAFMVSPVSLGGYRVITGLVRVPPAIRDHLSLLPCQIDLTSVHGGMVGRFG